jgi:ADP-ribose pyrophosphatase YjhB (NUDIX family)
MPAPPDPDVLARGPWAPEDVVARWVDDHFAPAPEATREADRAIEALRDRGSPSHDGLAARLVGYGERDGKLELQLQPLRWALRLVPGDAAASVSALCVTRAHDGRWLAGRRAGWLSQWAGRWTLGAGGAVDVGESPAQTLERELMEEWSVAPERLTVEALLRLTHGMVMVVGLAWLAPDAEVTPDHEHDAYAWWPADVDDWPAEASEELRLMARALSR